MKNSLETSYIELSEKAYRLNISFIKKLLHKNTALCAVIKGNAYGHGANEIISLAKKTGIDIFAVFSAEEAFDVINSIEKHDRLMIMGGTIEEQIEWAILNDVELFVHSVEHLTIIAKASRNTKKVAKVHLELETGMNRFGVEYENLDSLITILTANSQELNIMGLCTHFSGAESISNFERIRKQIQNFTESTEHLKKMMHQQFLLHAASSAATVSFPQTQNQMVRVGIMQYGLWPSQETRIEYAVKNSVQKNPLKRVISWKSHIASLKKVMRGEFIGYGTSYQTTQNKVIANIPVGYANGFSRSLSNQGVVLIRGKRASVVGVVNMNTVSVDVTSIPGVHIGDTVTLIGKDHNTEITISSFGDYSSQVNYELLTRLPKDISRTIV